jgi:Rieske Fe-S protein
LRRNGPERWRMSEQREHVGHVDQEEPVLAQQPVQICRREFVVRGSAGLSALLLAACAGVDTSPLSSSVVVNVANYTKLANVGGIVRINETSTPVALERTGTSTFVAYSLICPHQGQTVQVTGSTPAFFCPGHGAQFNANGQNVGGQRTGSLATYSAVYDAAANTVTIS